MPNSPERRAYLLLAAVVLLWGVNWPIMKAGLAYITPLWFAVARILLGAACLFPLVALQGRLRLPRRADLGVLITVGAFQVGVNTALVHSGIQFIEAGRSAILAYTTPLWVTPLAVLFLGERLQPRRLIGVGLGLTGIAVLTGSPEALVADRSALVGNGLLILAAMVLAAVMVHMRARGRAVQSVELAPWQLLLGGLVLVPVAYALEGPPSASWSAPFVAILAYNATLATAFALWAFVTVMRDLPATNTAVGSLGVPVVGVTASVIFFGEALPLAKVAGLALILAGVLIVTVFDLGRRRA